MLTFWSESDMLDYVRTYYSIDEVFFDHDCIEGILDRSRD